MSHNYQVIEGDLFKDDRGILSCVNNFNLNPILRFYEIAPKDTSLVRAWQAHKNESKWFYCTKGVFHIKLVKIDNFDSPSDDLDVVSIELNENKPRVLYIPGGYANGFKSHTDASKLLVFSDYSLEDSKADDFRYDSNKWTDKW